MTLEYVFIELNYLSFDRNYSFSFIPQLSTIGPPVLVSDATVAQYLYLPSVRIKRFGDSFLNRTVKRWNDRPEYIAYLLRSGILPAKCEEAYNKVQQRTLLL